MHFKHNSKQHGIFSLMSFPKSIKHTAFSTWVQDALCTMLKALFDAQIKIVQFCRKQATFTFPTSDWVAQLFKNNMFVESSWNVMAHGDARLGKWRGNWRMEWVASTLHTTMEHAVSSITTADAHTPLSSSQMNWCPPPPSDLNGFKRFAERQNLVSAHVPSHFKCSLPFTPMGASSALKYFVKVSMFVDASYLCSISHRVFFMSF
jgi:hypothetical protein